MIVCCLKEETSATWQGIGGSLQTQTALALPPAPVKPRTDTQLHSQCSADSGEVSSGFGETLLCFSELEQGFWGGGGDPCPQTVSPNLSSCVDCRLGSVLA